MGLPPADGLRSSRGSSTKKDEAHARDHFTDGWNGLSLLVQAGDSVQSGQDVVILESMKMEIAVQAEASGMVKSGTGRRQGNSLMKAASCSISSDNEQCKGASR